MTKTVAQRGAKAWALVFLVSSVACDADSPKDSENHVSDAGSEGPSCQENEDCLLVPTACCGSCDPTAADVRAVRADAEQNVCAVDCGACPEPTPGSIRPQLRAACVARHCMVVDLRKQDSTSCTADRECEARPTGCCPNCTDEHGWLALRKGVVDSTEPECTPIPPCLACAQVDPPSAVCDEDQHCAIKN